MKTTIALIIPIYNAGEFLTPCLDSVSRQTIPPDEVILIDDASNDGKQMYILDYAKKHKWVYFPNIVNLGPSASRNFGITLSKSSYFTFLDADDELMPDAIEKMKKAIAWRPNATMLQFNHVRHYLDKNKTITRVNLTAKRDIAQLDIHKKPYCKYWYSVWNKCFKRDDDTIMFDEKLRYGEDAIFVIKAIVTLMEQLVTTYGL